MRNGIQIFNQDTDDWGTLASATPKEKNYYCSSFKCAGNRTHKLIFAQSTQNWSNCPMCGSVLFTKLKRKRNRKPKVEPFHFEK